MQPCRQRPRASAGLAGHRLAPLPIICRLRYHSDRAPRHCAAGGKLSGTTMSHYFFAAGRFRTTPSAVTTLSCRMLQRPTAAALVARCGPTQLLPPAQLLAVPGAIQLSAIASSAHANRHATAPTAVDPIARLALLPHAPSPGTGQRPGKAGIKGLYIASHRRCAPRARGVTVNQSRAFAYPASALKLISASELTTAIKRYRRQRRLLFLICRR